MNELSVMNYVSRYLHTSISKYGYDFKLFFSCCVRKDFLIPFKQPEKTAEKLITESDTPLPRIISTKGDVIYSVIPSSDCFYILGPNLFSDAVLLNHRLPETVIHEFSSLPLHTCDFMEYIHILLMLYNLEEEKTENETDIIQENCVEKKTEQSIRESYTEMTFERHENEQPHNPYDQEIREQSSIENGDIAALRDSLAEDYVGTIGTLAKNPLRQAKNHAIVLITLASRSAIRGGISSEIAFSLSDSYIQKIEECRTTVSTLQIARNAEYEYTAMVHELKLRQMGSSSKEKSIYAQKCKNYIYSHLHDKLTVRDLANILGINANYLSEVFKQHEGITLSQFILREKIDRAKNLLTYSKYSYIEIATYLGFSSQSHLGLQFKKITGYTLRQYRNKFGVDGMASGVEA